MSEDESVNPTVRAPHCLHRDGTVNGIPEDLGDSVNVPNHCKTCGMVIATTSWTPKAWRQYQDRLALAAENAARKMEKRAKKAGLRELPHPPYRDVPDKDP